MADRFLAGVVRRSPATSWSTHSTGDLFLRLAPGIDDRTPTVIPLVLILHPLLLALFRKKAKRPLLPAS